ncbi:hypothetical protein SDC9_146545 [bioreactor metagenome]|uniref:Uncharacterized protein n=1 Tax=bioreactor metagenome TaxID=1076179 RepID=A0A645EBD3_9ZZZZ
MYQSRADAARVEVVAQQARVAGRDPLAVEILERPGPIGGRSEAELRGAEAQRHDLFGVGP